jgi:FdhD protein
LSEGVVPFQYHRYDGEWGEVEGEVIEEAFVSIFVNGQELATIMSTPRDQDRLALGFLCNEGLIDGLDDVRAVHICPSGACVDVWLQRAHFEAPKRRILTSGCGGGVTFNDLAQTLPPLDSGLRLPPGRLMELMIEMQRRGRQRRPAGGG